MGNTVSGSRDRSYDDFVDFGSLTPQGIYTGPQDWNQQVVENLIVDRKLAPFYRPLEDYDDSWDDDQILAARKELPISLQSSHSESSQGISSSRSHHGRSSNKNGKEPFRLSEASIYRGAVECPICFLVSASLCFTIQLFIYKYNSTILLTSIVLDVVTKLSVQNASFKSNVLSQPPPIWSRNQPLVPTVSKRTLV